VTRRHANAGARGSALIAVVIALVIVQIAVAGAVLAASREQDLTARRVESARALYAAEAAANIALAEIAHQYDDDGDGAVGRVKAGTLASGVAIGAAKAAASCTQTQYDYALTATGSCGAATHAFTLAATRPPAATTPGVYVEYYALAAAPGSCAAINWSAPDAAGVLPNVDLPYSASGQTRWTGGPSHLFALRYTAKVNIPAAGVWTFYVNSDDGSRLYINGTLVVSNDGDHAQTTKSGSINLPAGYADFVLQFYENQSASVVQAFWSGPTVASQTLIPPSAFRCSPTTAMPGVVGATGITLTGTGTVGALNVDGYDSSIGVYGGSNVYASMFALATNSTTASAFTINSGARVQGDAFSAKGSNPNQVIKAITGGVLTGSTSALPINVGVGNIYPSQGIPASAGPIALSFTYTVPPGTYHYSSIYVYGASNFTFTGETIVYCDGDLTITGSSTFNVQAGGKLIMYVGGNVTIDTTATCNMATQKPDMNVIYMYGTAKTFALNGSAKFCGYVHNPGGALSIASAASPSAEYAGVFLGNSVAVTGPAKLHVDLAFGALEGTTGGGTMRFTSFAQTN
jgi:hypothetical protein